MSDDRSYVYTRRKPFAVASSSAVSSSRDNISTVDNDVSTLVASGNSMSGSTAEARSTVQGPSGRPFNAHTDTPEFVSLLQLIARALQIHNDIISPYTALEASLSFSGIREYIGQGATFYVTTQPLPPAIMLEQSWPARLVVNAGDAHHWPNKPKFDNRIIAKRPVLEFNKNGALKDPSHNRRLRAVILEVQALTHHPLFYHKNIVDFLGVGWDVEPKFGPGNAMPASWSPKRVPSILLEYTQHGSLADARRSGLYTKMSFEERTSLCRDVAEGLLALHNCGIVHGDIKPDNILVFDAPEPNSPFPLCAKLADFGFSVYEDINQQTKELVGRTWPWNDPTWETHQTWWQLKKTDIFSYGLLVWATLSGHEIGDLFDVSRSDKDWADPSCRRKVDELKDSSLPWNAALYFKKYDEVERLLVECLFHHTLESTVEKRCTMERVVNIWNVWFEGHGYPPNQTISPGRDCDIMEHISHYTDTIHSMQFQQIIRGARLFPPSVKHELATSTFHLLSAFCFLTGWGVEQSLEEGKRLINEAIEKRIGNAAIFLPMFFTEAGVDERSLEHVISADLPLEEMEVALYLSRLQRHGSYQALRQYKKYFPGPVVVYLIWRSYRYREWKYQIQQDEHPWRHDATSDELCARQLDDIEQSFTHRASLLVRWKHNRLHFAVFSAFAEAVQLMLSASDFDRTLLEARDYNGDTPLLAAFRQGNFAIAKMLIEARANIAVVNHHGESVFHFLVEFDDPEEKTEITELVFARQPELAYKECSSPSLPKEPFYLLPHGKTPLVRVILQNDITLAKLFLKYGLSPFDPSPSPIIFAAAAHMVELLEIFWNAYPQQPEWRNGAMLGMAIKGYHWPQRMYVHGPRTKQMMEKTLDFLMERVIVAGGSLLIDDISPLHYALQESSDENIVQYLIQRTDASVINTRYPNGVILPIHLAVTRASNTTFEMLLQNGADPSFTVDYPGNNKLGTLAWCCIGWNGTPAMVKALLERQAEDITSDISSNLIPALTSAVLSNNFEAAKMLIDAGANVNAWSATGLRVLGDVIVHCSPETLAQVQFLCEYPKTPVEFIVKRGLRLSPFHIAAAIPDIASFYDRDALCNVLDYLLRRFPEPPHLNAQTEKGLTALHLASTNNPVVAKRLLQLKDVDLTLTSRTDKKTAYEYCVWGLVHDVPESVARRGLTAVDDYKKDQLEVRNMFAERLGEPQVDWTSFQKFAEYNVPGTTKTMHVVRVGIGMET